MSSWKWGPWKIKLSEIDNENYQSIYERYVNVYIKLIQSQPRKKTYTKKKQWIYLLLPTTAWVSQPKSETFIHRFFFLKSFIESYYGGTFLWLLRKE